MTTMLRLVQIVDVVVVAVMMMITLPSTGQLIAKLSLLLMMTMSSTGDQLKSDRCPFTGNPDRCIYELDHWYRSRWWWSWWSSSVCSPYWWSVNSYIVALDFSDFPPEYKARPLMGTHSINRPATAAVTGWSQTFQWIFTKHRFHSCFCIKLSDCHRELFFWSE